MIWTICSCWQALSKTEAAVSSYTRPPQLTRIGKRLWRVDVGFEYYIGRKDSGFVVKIEDGFMTDLASIPRAFRWLLPPDGVYTSGVIVRLLKVFGVAVWDWRYAHAAIVHDFLYTNAIATKRIADVVFYEAMGVSGVYSWLRFVMYNAVKIGGKGNFDRIEGK